jgi:hypothetical protein
VTVIEVMEKRLAALKPSKAVLRGDKGYPNRIENYVW